MLGLGAAMIVGGIVVEVARIGLIGGGLAVGASGLLLAYLDAPSRGRAAPPGMARAEATVLDAARTAGEVAAYPMVELTLGAAEGRRPVKRKLSAGRLGRFDQGRRIDVLYDPVDPQRIELA